MLPPDRQLDREEIAILVKRGRDFISSGDPAGARSVLQRAAESKDAEAALMLAASYDPVVLRKLKVYGFAADVAMARTWYKKAKEFGSAAALRRLEILASGRVKRRLGSLQRVRNKIFDRASTGDRATRSKPALSRGRMLCVSVEGRAPFPWRGR
jgi:TPR repeat protein